MWRGLCLRRSRREWTGISRSTMAFSVSNSSPIATGSRDIPMQSSIKGREFALRLPGLFIAVVIALLGADAKAAGGRVALVVGNSGYRNAPPIASGVNDAEDIAA